MSGTRRRFTRSMTSGHDEDEERKRFLQQGAEAAQEHVRRNSADKTKKRLSKPSTSGTQAKRVSRADQGERSAKATPDDVEASASIMDTPARIGVEDILTATALKKLAPPRLLDMGVPKSPSADTTILWRKDLEKRLLKPPVNIPLHTHLGRVIQVPPEAGERTNKVSIDKEVTFAKASTPHPVASIRSTESQLPEARQRELELEESEQLAEVLEEEYKAEFELHQKLFSLKKKLIKQRAIAKKTREESECSVRDEQSSGGTIARWIDESKDRAHEPVAEHTDRQYRNRSPPQMYEARENIPPHEPQTPHTRFTNETSPEVMVQLFERMQMAARPSPREVYQLPPFYGDISEWRSFINTYEESNRRCKFSEYENVARLRVALRGDAKTCVQHILSTATKPDLIIKVLAKQYGRSDFLVDKALENLRRMPPVGDSAHALNQFAIKIVNIVSTLIDLNQRYYADNPMIIREITDRLSPHLRSRWCEYARRYQRTEKAEIQLLADFLMEESDLQMSFTHARAPTQRNYNQPSRDLPPRTSNPWNRAREPPRPQRRNQPYTNKPVCPQYSHVAYAIQDINRSKVTCLYCGGGHSTTECLKFKAQHAGARWDWARDNRVCCRCLKGKHPSSKCRTSKKCDIQGCQHFHHKLLHGERIQHERQQAPEAAKASTNYERQWTRTPEQMEPPEDSNKNYNKEENTYASSSSTTQVLLKVIPLTLTGPKGEVSVYALLDEASTISMIEEEIADQIGATGPEEKIRVSGIGAICHESNSKTVNILIHAPEGVENHPIELRTVPALKIRGQKVDKELISKYEHLRDAHSACFELGVPQLLIGADYCQLMIPEEIKVGPQGAPVAIKCAIGWAIYGPVPKNLGTHDHSTYHVQSEADMELHQLVKRHCAVDSLRVSLKDNVKPLEERVISIFNSTVKKKHGKFEVGQLWQEDTPRRPFSYNMALTRLRIKEFADECRKQIKNYCNSSNPGPDGKSRSADVKTKHGTFRRPTLRLISVRNDECKQTKVQIPVK